MKLVYFETGQYPLFFVIFQLAPKVCHLWYFRCKACIKITILYQKGRLPNPH